VLPLQPDPERAQVAPLFAESFCKVAVKDTVALPATTLAVVGETLTDIGGGAEPAAARNATICMIHAPEDSVAVAL
jgi:hypothetical protein